MDKKTLKTAYTAAAAVITVLCTMLIIFLSAGKTQLHMDEVWSFGLANSYGSPQFYPTMDGVLGLENTMKRSEREDYQSFYNHWHPGSYFGDYVTVQQDERFAYGNVCRNQALDTSPPMYYMLIHTVCSFFPDSFSKWYGLIPNIIFYALSLWLVWLIANKLFSDRIKALAVLILYGISKAAISTAVFIRMYMLMTFFVLLLVWFFIRILETTEKKYIFAAMTVSILYHRIHTHLVQLHHTTYPQGYTQSISHRYMRTQRCSCRSCDISGCHRPCFPWSVHRTYLLESSLYTVSVAVIQSTRMVFLHG